MEKTMTNPAENPEDCCKLPAGVSVACPVSGKPGRKVAGVTLDYHLAPAHRGRMGEMAGFCANPDCVAVYFSGTVTIRKGETLLPITQKDPGDDVLVCYCFGIKRSDIRRDLAASGYTGIPERIRQGIAGGHCACKKKNPQGTCCLGDVIAEIGKIKEEGKRHGKE